jgi:Adenylate and Guanylate cyclase catalytic domain
MWYVCERCSPLLLVILLEWWVSGPVTAGLLRGEKSRFQLFGDSVHTASRMESNGVKGKFHVSESTAHELQKHNKGHWLVAREDKIVAKGKGEMQTYCVEVSGGHAMSHTGTVLTVSGPSEENSEESSRPPWRDTGAVLNGKPHPGGNNLTPTAAPQRMHAPGPIKKVLDSFQDEVFV